jgi:hypothetical protein
MLKIRKDGHEKCENRGKMVMKNVDIIFHAAYNKINRRRGVFPVRGRCVRWNDY